MWRVYSRFRTWAYVAKLCHISAMWLWATYLTLLFYCSHCEMRITKVHNSQCIWWAFEKLLLSHSVTSSSLQPHGLQHSTLPCPSLSLGVCSNSRPLSRWCHLTPSSFVATFSSCPQSFPASGSFSMSWLFPSGGQSIRASASVLPRYIQGWFPLELIALISLLSKGVSGIFSSSTI